MSVVIPCYNYGHYLPQCVASITSQPGVEVRIVIIDDASTDDSAAVAERLAAADRRIEVRRHAANQGHIATYNEGLLRWAAGDYTVLISADDLLTPGALHRAISVLEGHPEVGMAYGRAVSFTADEPPPPSRAAPLTWQIWSGPEWIETRCRLSTTSLRSPEVVARTELWHEVGGFRHELPHTGDQEMWLRLATRAGVAFIGADQAYYRLHPQSMSNTQFASPVVDANEHAKAFDLFLKEQAGSIPDADRLRAVAMRSIARAMLWQACRRCRDPRRPELASIEELVDFAFSIHPGTGTLPEYWGLRWRRRLGPRAIRLMEPLLLPVLARRRLRRLRIQCGRLWWREALRLGVTHS